MLRVTLSNLSRLPVERLAQLLMQWAVEDPRLLVRLHATLEENRAAPARPAQGKADIIGQSTAIRHAVEMIDRFARTEEPVLITGESGTGKELAALAIHDRSPRRDGPFVAVNCAALPSTLVASELFGYEKGAFTGALARTKGRIEHANGGTLFLDEIGDMPVDLQGHLLRFLQDGEIVRVGGREVVRVDVRVVAATNVRLRQAITEGRFREDLYYRLNILALLMPPLRERPEDIGQLAHHALGQAAVQFGREATGFSPDAMDALRRHDWPGNVRELMATVRRAVVIGDTPVVTLADLAGLKESPPRPAAAAIRPSPGSNEERTVLIEALAGTQENITLAAQELGVSRVTLYRMLRRHSIMLGRGLRAPPVAG
jgi:transcriptional regulator with PAS, ATPase and Fis domain